MKRLAPLVLVAALVAACSPPPDVPQPSGGEGRSARCAELSRRADRHSYGHRRWRERCRPPRPTPTTSSTTTTTSTVPSTTTTTTSTTVPSGAPRPVGLPSWPGRLIFADEFSGSSLDLSKWRPNWLAGSDTAVSPPVNTAEASCYDPGHVSVSGGALVLRADSSVPPGCRTRSGSARYASGLVQTDDDFHFRYGFAEARIEVPGSCAAGQNWPAFWTNGQSWPTDGEIDVMEVLDGSATWHYHWSGGSAGGRGDHLACEAGWHTFGVAWEPGRLRFFYDGALVGEHTRGVTSSEHYLILNLALSESISGPIVVPSILRADYVRVWSLN